MLFEDLIAARELPDKSLYDPSEASVLLGVTRSTISSWCRENRLAGFKAGKHWKFVTRESLKAFVEAVPDV